MKFFLLVFFYLLAENLKVEEIMVKQILFLMCFGAIAANCANNSCTSDDCRAQKVENAIKEVMKRNRKIRSVISVFETYGYERDAEMVKPISLEIGTRKGFSDEDSKFSHFKLTAGVSGGVNTLFHMAAAQSKYMKRFYSTIEPASIKKEVNDIITEYLTTEVNHCNKKELLKITADYVQTKKRDLGEMTVRMRHGDVSKDELAEAVADLKAAESEYAKVELEAQMSGGALQVYMSKDADDDGAKNLAAMSVQGLELEDIEAFVHKSGLLRTDDHVKAEHELDKTFCEKMESISEFTPQFRLSFDKFLCKDSEKEKFEKDGLSLSIFVNLAPYRFCDVLKFSRNHEAAKLSVAWERAIEKFQLEQKRSEIRTTKKFIDSLKAAVESKRLLVESMEAQFKGGFANMEKLRNARSQYYSSVKNYHDNVEKYVEKVMKYLSLSGKIREVFFEVYPEFAQDTSFSEADQKDNVKSVVNG